MPVLDERDRRLTRGRPGAAREGDTASRPGRRVRRAHVARDRGAPMLCGMEGSVDTRAWLRCYRCWSTDLEVQVHYEGIHKIDADSGERGTREFFTHVRFHKHEDDTTITVHLLVELYARSQEEATEVLEAAARGRLAITSLAEESRPPAATGDDPH